MSVSRTIYMGAVPWSRAYLRLVSYLYFWDQSFGSLFRDFLEDYRPSGTENLDPWTIARIQYGLVGWLITTLPFQYTLKASNPCVSTCSQKCLQYLHSDLDVGTGPDWNSHQGNATDQAEGCPKAPPHLDVRCGARGDYLRISILVWFMEIHDKTPAIHAVSFHLI